MVYRGARRPGEIGGKVGEGRREGRGVGERGEGEWDVCYYVVKEGERSVFLSWSPRGEGGGGRGSLLHSLVKSSGVAGESRYTWMVVKTHIR